MYHRAGPGSAFFSGVGIDPDLVFQRSDPDPVQNRLDPQHWSTSQEFNHYFSIKQMHSILSSMGLIL
jgi:hypothetical protein